MLLSSRTAGLSRPLQARGLSLATTSLVAAARAAQQQTGFASQADVLGLFAPQFRNRAFSSSSQQSDGQGGRRGKTFYIVSPRRKSSLSPLVLKRFQHVQPQETHSSGPPPPPPSRGHGKQQKSEQTSEAKPKQGPLYQKAGSAPENKDAPVSTSDISRVSPVSGVPGAELGSDANQLSASQALLAEKQEKELEAKEAEERWKRQPLVKRAWIKVKEEAAHYWHGTKLLAKEVKISARLLRRLMLGYNLTRREHRQVS